MDHRRVLKIGFLISHVIYRDAPERTHSLETISVCSFTASMSAWSLITNGYNRMHRICLNCGL